MDQLEEGADVSSTSGINGDSEGCMDMKAGLGGQSSEAGFDHQRGGGSSDDEGCDVDKGGKFGSFGGCGGVVSSKVMVKTVEACRRGGEEEACSYLPIPQQLDLTAPPCGFCVH